MRIDWSAKHQLLVNCEWRICSNSYPSQGEYSANWQPWPKERLFQAQWLLFYYYLLTRCHFLMTKHSWLLWALYVDDLLKLPTQQPSDDRLKLVLSAMPHERSTSRLPCPCYIYKLTLVLVSNTSNTSNTSFRVVISIMLHWNYGQDECFLECL